MKKEISIDYSKLTKLYYSISEVAQLFEVNASLIRFWEKELESYKIKKFILFVACDLSEKKRQQQIIKENI
jgi:transposase-like protein